MCVCVCVRCWATAEAGNPIYDLLLNVNAIYENDVNIIIGKLVPLKWRKSFIFYCLITRVGLTEEAIKVSAN